jgi:hypothetical protein
MWGPIPGDRSTKGKLVQLPSFPTFLILKSLSTHFSSSSQSGIEAASGPITGRKLLVSRTQKEAHHLRIGASRRFELETQGTHVWWKCQLPLGESGNKKVVDIARSFASDEAPSLVWGRGGLLSFSLPPE